ncbi:MAG: leucine-rich repeat domain-containing protein, partial [Psychrosphaera sp.]|nr:leucine-rich repeat domain-containing protein [Psychrosphaera sp.]
NTLDPSDFDGDGITNALDNCPWAANTEQLNHDALDDEGNACDFDDDNDGMPDEWEILYGFNPWSAVDGSEDADDDGYPNLIEFENGTDPQDYYSTPQQVSAPQSLFQVNHGTFSGELVIDEDGIIYGYLERFGDSNKDTLVAMDNAGQIIWQVAFEQSVVAHPVIDNQGNILCSMKNGIVYAIDNTGQLNWTIDLNSQFYNAVSVGPDGSIYQSASFGRLFALSPNGKLQWQWETEGSVSKPVISLNNQIMVATKNGLHALSSDGQQLWQFEYDSWQRQSPVIDSFGNIYHTTYNKVFSLTANGNLRWQYTADDNIYQAPVVDKKGQVYLIAGSNGSSSHHALNRHGQLRWSSKRTAWSAGGYTLTDQGYLLVSESYNYNIIGMDGSVKFSSEYLGSNGPKSNILIGADDTFYYYTANYLIAYKLDGISTNEDMWYTSGGSFARNGLMKLADFDGDGFADSTENCPYIANSDQLNTDQANDGGDACDNDDDNDGVLDMFDAFPLDSNESVDTDNDGIGNNADTDDDNDGIEDINDEYPLDPSQTSFGLIAGVVFSDANLAACVLEAATTNEWTTVDQMTNLSCVSQSISDLTGLEQFIRLTQLDLRKNTVSDIRPLADLTALTLLKLSKNNVQDITWLANLTALTFLSLSENNFDPSQVSALAGLTDLTTLYLNGNQIVDISPLVDLTNLTRLYLYDNQIADISWLSPMAHLRTLRLEKNQITDITTLSDLTTLNLLDLRQNQVNEIVSIAGLTRLTILKLSKNELADIQTLASFRALTFLSLSGNKFDQSTLDVLSGLTALKTLYLRNSQIVDISPLARLTALTRLYLKDNQIVELDALSNLAQLNILQLSNNQITAINILMNMTNAKNIDLRGNSDISCAELDALDEALGAGVVRRPDTCG